MKNKIVWPDGKKFAFTIFDDTDLSRPGNYEVVYDFLRDLGFKTTKSVWPLHHTTPGYIEGSTIEEKGTYLDYHKSLQASGFEIGYHCSSFSSHHTQDIARGLDLFKKEFGHDPVSMSNHADSKEAIYWGSQRLSGPNRWLYNLATRFRQTNSAFGENQNSQYFWGDICQSRIKYVRNFITGDINTLKQYPLMPYHDPSKAYVPYWYSSSEGPEVNSFNHTIREQAQDRLEDEGGACIMYTHFACGFQENGKLNPRFKELMTRLAKKNGWYVPTATLLDFLLHEQQKNYWPTSITPIQRIQMESKWLLHKFKVGGTS